MIPDELIQHPNDLIWVNMGSQPYVYVYIYIHTHPSSHLLPSQISKQHFFVFLNFAGIKLLNNFRF